METFDTSSETNGGDEIPSEQFSFNYEQVRWQYAKMPGMVRFSNITLKRG